jgi:hypothetical protein
LTRRLLFPASWLLWLVAMAYRLAHALERPLDEPDSEWGLAIVLGALGGYVAWRMLILANGSEWQYGWRK